jgi:hypothetical protein
LGFQILQRNTAALFKAPRPFEQCTPLGTLHNLNRHAEVDEPRLQERQRQHVLRVDIMCTVAGVGSDIEL